jgi:hypothetical protein
MALELNLAGKKAVVTGSSEGIGAAIAERLGSERVDLYLVARNADKLKAVAKSVRDKYGVKVTTMPGDLSTGAHQQAVAEKAADADILVNNAGAIPAGNIFDVDEARWRAAWDLKVFGYINMSRAFYSHMKKRGAGVIVNVIGVGGEKPVYEYIAGAAGNAALMAFTRALGGHSPVDGIRVVAINPGPVDSERLVTVTKKAAQDRLDGAENYLKLWKNFPFGRPATTMEIADMVAFLASERSAYTSGTVITIDGGSVNRGPLF